MAWGIGGGRLEGGAPEQGQIRKEGRRRERARARAREREEFIDNQQVEKEAKSTGACRGGVGCGKEESVFKAKAERDHATPAQVDESLTPIPSIHLQNLQSVYMCVFVCLCLCVRVCSTAPNAGGRASGRQRKLLLFLLPHHCRSPRPLKGEHVLPLLLFLLLRRRRRRLLLAGARAPKAVLLGRALCLPTFSHFLIVNKTSLSLSRPIPSS